MVCLCYGVWVGVWCVCVWVVGFELIVVLLFRCCWAAVLWFCLRVCCGFWVVLVGLLG